MVTARDARSCGMQPPQWEAGCHQFGLNKHTHIQDRPTRVRKTQRHDAQRYAQGQGDETPGNGTRMTGSRQLRLPFFYWVINPPRHSVSKYQQHAQRMPILRCSATQNGRIGAGSHSCSRFTVPRFSMLPGRNDTGRVQSSYLSESFMSAKQPTRKPTGKRKESDASARIRCQCPGRS